MRGLTRSRKTAELTEQFVLLKEPHCLGFNSGKLQTVQQWIDEQQIAVYNKINDKLMPIISLKKKCLPGVLDLQSRQQFFTALYDLDGFRSQIINNGLLNDFQFDAAMLDKALTDDLMLLEVGMRWIRHVLFDHN
jgi:hypothetical protein